jgi:hypothetical protein
VHDDELDIIGRKYLLFRVLLTLDTARLDYITSNPLEFRYVRTLLSQPDTCAENKHGSGPCGCTKKE